MKNILEEYKEKGLVYCQTHPTLPLTVYNYTDVVQWEGLWDDVTLQARALVVDDVTGEVVARPFKKFFNLSEGRTKTTNEYEIWEKLDGSLIIAFYYGGDWVLASRGSFTSDQAIKAREFFKDSLLNKDLTYCFEILYAENRIVCKYDYEGLVLTAAFNSKSGEEVVISGVTEYREARRFNFNTPLDTLHQIIDDNEEGYVVRFSNGERCKIKGAEYLRLHKAMSEMSTTAIWECLMNGTSVVDAIQDLPDEFYQLVKDYEKELEQEYKQVEEDIFKQYISLVKDVDDKTFALSIENHPLKSFFFSLRNKKDVEKAIWKKIKPNFRKL